MGRDGVERACEYSCLEEFGLSGWGGLSGDMGPRRGRPKSGDTRARLYAGGSVPSEKNVVDKTGEMRNSPRSEIPENSRHTRIYAGSHITWKWTVDHPLFRESNLSGDLDLWTIFFWWENFAKWPRIQSPRDRWLGFQAGFVTLRNWLNLSVLYLPNI